MTTLAAPDRAILVSASATLDSTNHQGFSRFLANGLRRGASVWEAFEAARQEQQKLFANLPLPQLDDDGDGQMTEADGQWLNEVFVNGDFAGDNPSLTLTGDVISLPTAVSLQAQVNSTQNMIQRVWAVVKLPHLSSLPIATLDLSFTKEDNTRWMATWDEVTYNGEYEILFYAQDSQGNLVSSAPAILTVTDKIEAPKATQVQVTLDKEQYHLGDTVTAQLTENLGWGYDLYAALVLPDGQFQAIPTRNKFASPNQPRNWVASRHQGIAMTLLEWSIPNDFPTGSYCLYGILSPAREDVFEALNQERWVWEKQCFEIVLPRG
jgi:hypothetical protein